jgi:hypothetical protein
MSMKGLLEHVRRHVVAYVALFFAISGTALAGSSYITKSETITKGDLVGSAYGAPVIAAHKVTDTKLAHSSLTVSTATGLTGGGSISLGGLRALSVSPSFRLPQSCTSGQVAESNGSGAWSCATVQNGTVTEVDSGTGLDGGSITTTGTLSIDPAYQLPQSCTSGQVPKASGSGSWSCDTPASVTQMMGGSAGNLNTVNANYLAPAGLSTPSATESDVEVGASTVASSANDLSASVSAAPGTGSSWNVLLRANGQNILACSISGTATSCTDPFGPNPIPAGAVVSFEATPVGNTPAAARITFGWTDST